MDDGDQVREEVAEEEMKARDQLAEKEKDDGDHGKEGLKLGLVEDQMKASELVEKEKQVRVLTDSVKDRVPAQKMSGLMSLPAA